ncbi:MAG: hypothetical protein IPL52_17980 [Flavobacteriales bacterium]|nr:hypothetical protein [Flavobacteriales bacterium]
MGGEGELPALLDTGYTWFMDDACEKRMVVPHANGIDYWFVGQEIGTNIFQAYPITADGIAEQPVESQSGPCPSPTSGRDSYAPRCRVIGS